MRRRGGWSSAIGRCSFLGLFLVGCMYDVPPRPQASVGVSTQSIGPEGGVVPFEGVVRFDLVWTIPSGALFTAESARFNLMVNPHSVSFHSGDSVEVIVPGPIDEEVLIVSPTAREVGFDFEPPGDCEQGCVVVFHVSFRQVSDGAAPTLSWNAGAPSRGLSL